MANNNKRNKPSLLEAMAASQKAARARTNAQASAERKDRSAEPVHEVFSSSVTGPIERVEPEPPAPDPDESVLDDFDAHAPIRVAGSRVHISLGTVGCMVVAASVCLVAIAAYSMGRRGAGGTSREIPALAVNPANPNLNPAPSAEPPRTRIEQRLGDAELTRLLQAPPTKTPADQPAPSKTTPAAAKPEPANPQNQAGKPLHYLHIDTFRYGRGSSRADVLAELQDVQRFLAARGVASTYRDTGKEFILLGSHAVTGIRDADAVQYHARIEQYGREYRKAGGRYEFKGCFWRSESTIPGKPADPPQE